MNIDEPELVLFEAQRRVLKIQAKLHLWARDDSHRRFDDLFNLVTDPGFLLVAWDRRSRALGSQWAVGARQRPGNPSVPPDRVWAVPGDSQRPGQPTINDPNQQL